MLIALSDAFLGRTDALASDREFRIALGNLLLAFQEGKHVIFASRALIQELRKISSFDQKLKIISQREQESHSLLNKICCMIEVTPNRGEEITREQRGNVTRFLVPYTWFVDSERIQMALLITEDRRDAVVYERAARGYLHGERLKVKVALQPVPGGGGNSAGQIEAWLGKRLIICILDSDRCSPNGRLGLTAKRAEALPIANQVAELRILDCHEIENILPEALLDAALTDLSGPKKEALSKKLDQLKVLGVFKEQSCAFLDLKTGLSLRKVLSGTTEDVERSYVGSLVSALRPRLPLPPGGWCERQPRCASFDCCECILFDNGWPILEHVTTYLERESNSTILFGLFFGGPQGTMQNRWRDIAASLFSWGCAFSKVAG